MNSIIIEKLKDDMPDLFYAHEGDAGIDCYAADGFVINPLETARIPLGIKIELPKNKAAFVLPRSGLSSRLGLSAVTGLIDNGYRGEISMIAHNISKNQVIIKKNDKICQLMIFDAPQCKIEYGRVSDNTERGDCGFGSTGV